MSAQITQIMLAVIGSGGLIGGIVALLKLKPEANTAAVAQAGSVMAQMRVLNDEALETAARWKERAEEAEQREAAALRRAATLEARVRELGG